MEGCTECHLTSIYATMMTPGNVIEELWVVIAQSFETGDGRCLFVQLYSYLENPICRTWVIYSLVFIEKRIPN